MSSTLHHGGDDGDRQARALGARQHPPAAFALGATIEPQDDADVVGQHQRLDLAPQAA